MRSRTGAGIVGAGPAGLLLSHLSAARGIKSVLVEKRCRACCEARQRTGVLEAGTVPLLFQPGGRAPGTPRPPPTARAA
ncbi:MAG: FAD-dependent monooxygenase [Streptosporangiaceae bacterium]